MTDEDSCLLMCLQVYLLLHLPLCRECYCYILGLIVRPEAVMSITGSNVTVPWEQDHLGSPRVPTPSLRLFSSNASPCPARDRGCRAYLSHSVRTSVTSFRVSLPKRYGGAIG